MVLRVLTLPLIFLILISITCVKKEPVGHKIAQSPSRKRVIPTPHMVEGTVKDSILNIVLTDQKTQSLILLMDQKYGVIVNESLSVVISHENRYVTYVNLCSDSTNLDHYIYYDLSMPDTVYAFTLSLEDSSLTLAETYGAYSNLEGAVVIEPELGYVEFNQKVKCISGYCLACALGCLSYPLGWLYCFIACCGLVVLFCLLGWL
jgi:hypothetical protein